VTLATSQIPAHSHTPVANTAGGLPSPSGNVWAGWSGMQYLNPPSTSGQMNAGAVQAQGGSQPHDNMLPYLVINFIIATEGVFPTQS
jgi:microcystin-dependent protein